LRITNEDVPMPYAANLEKAMLVNADKIVAGVRQTLGV
jgi:pyruvate dehydrogenase E1 component beta subunit